MVCWTQFNYVCGNSSHFLVNVSILVEELASNKFLLLGAKYNISFTVQMPGVDSFFIDLYQGTSQVLSIAPVTPLQGVKVTNLFHFELNFPRVLIFGMWKN